MPRAGRRFPDGLAIEIDDLQATYLPGDTLTGRIVCSRLPGEDPARLYHVRVNLYGRAKTKYIVKTSNGTSINRGRAVLFNVSFPPSSEPTLGGAGVWTWPFTVTIPTTIQPALAAGGGEWRPDGKFLATKDAGKNLVDVTQHPLPAVMYHYAKSSASGKTSEAYVEYVLQAKVATLEATMPLFLRVQGTDAPVKDFKLRASCTTHLLRTPRLLAEHADSELTFRQKTSRFFKPSHTPRYTYSVKVEYPSLLQLEHPDPLPLRIAIVPDLNPEKTTICPNGDLQSLPPVKLTSIKLELQMQLDIRCPGTFYDHENEKKHTVNIPFLGILKPWTIPVIPAPALKYLMSAPDQHDILMSRVREVQLTPNLRSKLQKPSADAMRSLNYADPLNADPSDGDRSPPPYTSVDTEPLHLGKHLSVFIGSSACSVMGRPPVSFKRQLYPTFKTYNIRLTYQLRWKIGLECAGETQSVSGEGPLTIIPPSEEQEALKKRELGTDGMKKNYDDLAAGMEQGLQFVGAVLSVVGG